MVAGLDAEPGRAQYTGLSEAKGMVAGCPDGSHVYQIKETLAHIRCMVLTTERRGKQVIIEYHTWASSTHKGILSQYI